MATTLCIAQFFFHVQIVSSDWLVQLLVATGVASGQLGLQVKWKMVRFLGDQGALIMTSCGRGRFNQSAKSKLNLHMS